MDLKNLAGKNVVIQFKPGLLWYIHKATDEGVPLITLQSPQKPDPMVSPFLLGEVQEDGAVRIDTDFEGELDVYVASDAIFSVAVVRKPATAPVSTFAKGSPEPSRIVRPSTN